jgi:hypothetical protein
MAASVSVDDKVGRVDPREQMWRTYQAMRERMPPGYLPLREGGNCGRLGFSIRRSVTSVKSVKFLLH